MRKWLNALVCVSLLLSLLPPASAVRAAAPTPTEAAVTATPTAADPTATSSPTATQTAEPLRIETATQTPAATASATATASSILPPEGPTETATATGTATVTATLVATPTITITPTATVSATLTVSPTATITPSSQMTGTVDIDPSIGGEIASEDGLVQVSFPPAAVSGRTKAKHTARPMPPPGNPSRLVRRFALDAWSPADNTKVTQFSKPLTITMHFTESLILNYVPSSLKLVYWDQTEKDWFPLSTTVDLKARTLSATTTHFSEFGTTGNGYVVLPIALDRAQVSLYTGAATFEYPLEVLPGPNGLSPNLTLSYNSGAVEETTASTSQIPWVGLGWNLNLGSIRRVKKDEWTPERFFLELNGMSDELVLVQEYGNSQSYKTKNDTYLQITREIMWPTEFQGSIWTITSTNGTVYKFGYDTGKNSRNYFTIWEGSCPEPWLKTYYKWGLDEVVDTSGNSMSINYVVDPGSWNTGCPGDEYQKAVYPQQVTYASTDAGGAKRRVDFVSTQRANLNGSGGATQETRKLDEVRVWVTVDGLETLARKYKFDYENSQGQDLILKKVTQYGTDGTSSLPPLSLSYAAYRVREDTISNPETGDCWSWADSLRQRVAEIDNGYGGKVTYLYYQAIPSACQQWSRQAVGARQVSAGMGVANTWYYTYTGYLYVGTPYTGPEGEFRGYSQVDVLDPAGAKTISFFKQDDIFRGRNYQTDTYDAGGSLLRRIVNTYSGYTAGANVVTLAETHGYEYPGNRHSHNTYRYDSYGNPTAEFAYGDTLPAANAGFEDGNGQFQGWQVWNSDPNNPVQTSVIGYASTGGLYSLRLGPGGRASVYQDIPGLTPGSAYTVSFNTFGQYLATAQIRLATDNGQSGNWQGLPFRTPGPYWETMTQRYTADSTGKVRVIIDFSPGEGYIYVDDVYVKPADSPAEVKSIHRGYATKTDTAYIVDRLGWENLYEGISENVGGSAMKSQAWYFYDDSSSYGTVLDKGRLTRVDQGRSGDFLSTSTFAYDTYGNRTTTVEPGGRVINIAYDSTYHTYPMTTTISPSPGGMTQRETRLYDYYIGEPYQIQDDINLSRVRYGFDNFGRMIKVWRETEGYSDTPTKQITINNGSVGVPTKVLLESRKDLGGTSPASVYREWSFYDGLGRLIQTQADAETAGQAIVKSIAYDALGRKEKESVPTATSSPGIYQTPNWASLKKTTYSYDALSRPTRTTGPDDSLLLRSYAGWGTAASDAKGHAKFYHNDAFGRLTKVEEPLVTYTDPFDFKDSSKWTFNSYQTTAEGGNNVLRSTGTGVDWNGNFYANSYTLGSGQGVELEFKADSTSSWSHFALESYDGGVENRWGVIFNYGKIYVQYKDGGDFQYPADLITGAQANRWYVVTLKLDDADGFYVEVRERDNPSVRGSYSRPMPTGKSWRFHHWILSGNAYIDNYQAITYQPTAYRYNTLGSLSSVLDPQSNQTQMSYDSQGRKTSMVDPDMGGWSYRYDAAGNLSGQTDAKGQQLKFAYDTNNRLTAKYDSTAFGTYVEAARTIATTPDLREYVGTVQMTFTVNAPATDNYSLLATLHQDSEQANPRSYGALSKVYVDGNYAGTVTTKGGRGPYYTTYPTWMLGPGQTERFPVSLTAGTHSVRIERVSGNSGIETAKDGSEIALVRGSQGSFYQYDSHLLDRFDTKDTSLWTFSTWQSVAILDNQSVIRSTGSGTGYDASMIRTASSLEDGDRMELEFKSDSTNPRTYFRITNGSEWLGLSIKDGPIWFTYVDGSGFATVPTGSNMEANVWYVMSIRLHGDADFFVDVWKKDNPEVRARFTRPMPAGKKWYFTHHLYNAVNVWVDSYAETYSWAAGKRTGIADGTGGISYRYDKRGRLNREEKVIDGHLYTTTLVYDAMDRVASTTYPGGEVLTNTYNSQALLTKVSSSLGPEYLSSATYNSRGQPLVMTFGANKAKTEYSYYEDGVQPNPSSFRLREISSYVPGGSTLQKLDYEYDKVGNVAKLSDRIDDGDGVESQAYTYDVLDRLLAAMGSTQGTPVYTQTFAYSAIGNITSMASNYVTNTYAYTTTKPHAVGSISGGVSNTYTYDANGNTTSGAGRIIAWDAENRPVTITLSGITTTFAYDADGKRVKKAESNGSTVTTTLYVGNYYEQVLVNGVVSETVKYYYAGGRRIAMQRTPTGGTAALSYIFADHLGSTSVVSSTVSGQISRSFYYPFGSQRASNGSLQTDRLFTGQRLDGTGLYDYNARLYDPYLGRFISPDIVVPKPQNPQDLNRYSYGRNNPIRLTDPTGNIPVEPEDFGVAAWKFYNHNGELVVALLPSIPDRGYSGNGWSDWEQAAMRQWMRDSGRIKEYEAGMPDWFEAVQDYTEGVMERIATWVLSGRGIGRNAVRAELGLAGVGSAAKATPKQVHHSLSNKNQKYTPEFKKITDKYELDLDGDWNKGLIQQQGRHPNDYHEWALRKLREADKYASGDKKKFLEYYNKNIRKPVEEDPNMLRKWWWLENE